MAKKKQAPLTEEAAGISRVPLQTSVTEEPDPIATAYAELQREREEQALTQQSYLDRDLEAENRRRLFSGVPRGQLPAFQGWSGGLAQAAAGFASANMGAAGLLEEGANALTGGALTGTPLDPAATWQAREDVNRWADVHRAGGAGVVDFMGRMAGETLSAPGALGMGAGAAARAATMAAPAMGGALGRAAGGVSKMLGALEGKSPFWGRVLKEAGLGVPENVAFGVTMRGAQGENPVRPNDLAFDAVTGVVLPPILIGAYKAAARTLAPLFPGWAVADYAAPIVVAARNHGVDPALIASIVKRDMRPEQLADLDPSAVFDQIGAGLKRALDANDGNVRRAIAEFGAGADNAARGVELAGNPDLFTRHRAYARDVMDEASRIRRLMDKEAAAYNANAPENVEVKGDLATALRQGTEGVAPAPGAPPSSPTDPALAMVRSESGPGAHMGSVPDVVVPPQGGAGLSMGSPFAGELPPGVRGALPPSPMEAFDQARSGGFLLNDGPNGEPALLPMPADLASPEGVALWQRRAELAQAMMADPNPNTNPAFAEALRYQQQIEAFNGQVAQAQAMAAEAPTAPIVPTQEPPAPGTVAQPPMSNPTVPADTPLPYASMPAPVPDVDFRRAKQLEAQALMQRLEAGGEDAIVLGKRLDKLEADLAASAPVEEALPVGALPEEAGVNALDEGAPLEPAPTPTYEAGITEPSPRAERTYDESIPPVRITGEDIRYEDFADTQAYRNLTSPEIVDDLHRRGMLDGMQASILKAYQEKLANNPILFQGYYNVLEDALNAHGMTLQMDPAKYELASKIAEVTELHFGGKVKSREDMAGKYVSTLTKFLRQNDYFEQLTPDEVAQYTEALTRYFDMFKTGEWRKKGFDEAHVQALATLGRLGLDMSLYEPGTALRSVGQYFPESGRIFVHEHTPLFVAAHERLHKETMKHPYFVQNNVIMKLFDMLSPADVLELGRTFYADETLVRNFVYAMSPIETVVRFIQAAQRNEKAIAKRYGKAFAYMKGVLDKAPDDVRARMAIYQLVTEGDVGALRAFRSYLEGPEATAGVSSGDALQAATEGDLAWKLYERMPHDRYYDIGDERSWGETLRHAYDNLRPSVRGSYAKAKGDLKHARLSNGVYDFPLHYAARRVANEIDAINFLADNGAGKAFKRDSFQDAVDRHEAARRFRDVSMPTYARLIDAEDKLWKSALKGKDALATFFKRLAAPNARAEARDAAGNLANPHLYDGRVERMHYEQKRAEDGVAWRGRILSHPALKAAIPTLSHKLQAAAGKVDWTGIDEGFNASLWKLLDAGKKAERYLTDAEVGALGVPKEVASFYADAVVPVLKDATMRLKTEAMERVFRADEGLRKYKGTGILLDEAFVDGLTKNKEGKATSRQALRALVRNYKGGYMPQVREGEFTLFIQRKADVDADGKKLAKKMVWAEGAATREEAEKKLAALMQTYDADKHVSWVDRRDSPYRFGDTLREEPEIVDRIKQLISLTDAGHDLEAEDLIRALMEEENPRGLDQYFQHRQDIPGYEKQNAVATILRFTENVSGHIHGTTFRERMRDLSDFYGKEMPSRKAEIETDMDRYYRNITHQPSAFDRKVDAFLKRVGKAIDTDIPYWKDVTAGLREGSFLSVLGAGAPKRLLLDLSHFSTISYQEISTQIAAYEKRYGKKATQAQAEGLITFQAMPQAINAIMDVPGARDTEMHKAWVEALEKGYIHRDENFVTAPGGKLARMDKGPKRGILYDANRALETLNAASNELRQMTSFIAFRQTMLNYGVDATLATARAGELTMRSLDIGVGNKPLNALWLGDTGGLMYQFKGFLFNALDKIIEAKRLAGGHFIEVANPAWKKGANVPETIDVEHKTLRPLLQMAAVATAFGGLGGIPGVAQALWTWDATTGDDIRLRIRHMMEENLGEELGGPLGALFDEGLPARYAGVPLDEFGWLMVPKPDHWDVDRLVPPSLSIMWRAVKDGGTAAYEGRTMDGIRAVSPSLLKHIEDIGKLWYNQGRIYNAKGEYVADEPLDVGSFVRTLVGGLRVAKAESFRLYENDQNVRAAANKAYAKDAKRVADKIVANEELTVDEVMLLKGTPGFAGMVKRRLGKMTISRAERVRRQLDRDSNEGRAELRKRMYELWSSEHGPAAHAEEGEERTPEEMLSEVL